MKKLMCVCLVAFAVCSIGGGLARADLQNGSFEAPPISGLVVQVPTGWNAMGNSGAIRLNSALHADGNQCLSIGPEGNCGVSQYTGIQLVDGQTYTISWSYASSTAGANGWFTIFLAPDATSQGENINPNMNFTAPVANVWYTASLSHTASGSMVGKYYVPALEVGSGQTMMYDNVTLTVANVPTATPTPVPPTPTPTEGPTPTPGGLVNGSFELPVVSGHVQQMPTGWNWAFSYNVYLDTTTHVDGNQCLWLQGNGAWQNTGIQLVQGTVYTFNYSYASPAAGNGAWVTIFLAPSSMDYGDNIAPNNHHSPIAAANVWYEGSLSHTANSWSAGKYLVLSLETDNSVMYDNVTLTIEAEPTPTPTPTPTEGPTPTPSGLVNGSFELPVVSGHVQQMPTGWNWAFSYNVYLDTTTHVDGNQCLWLEGNGAWQNTGIPLVEGSTYTYTYSYAAPTAGNGAWVTIFLANSPTTQGENTYPNNHHSPIAAANVWYNGSLAHTATSETAGKYLVLALETDNQVMYDNVALTVAVAEPTPTDTPTPTPTDGPTPTPCDYVGLQNGDFELDDIGGLGSALNTDPANWTSTPADCVWIDYSEPWCGSNTVKLAGSGNLSCWQNVGGMVEGTTYYITLSYANYSANRNASLKLYAGYACDARGGDVVYTSPVLTTAAAKTFYPFQMWYTCDAAHAGKSLTISLEGPNETNFDNVTLVADAGPTPTLIPTPTPTLTPTPIPAGLFNGSFELPADAPSPDNYSYSQAPTGWNMINPSITDFTESTGIHNTDGWSPVDGVQLLSVGRFTSAKVWQNTRIAMLEGKTYQLSFSATRLIGSTGGSFNTPVTLNAANDPDTIGTTVATLDLYPVVFPWNWHIWTPQTVSYTCSAANAGKYLAIVFNGNYSCPGIDNLTLSVLTPLTVPVRLLDFDPVDPTVPTDVKAKIWDADGNVVSEQNVTLATAVAGQVTAMLPAGTYYVAVKPYQHVQRVIEVVKGDDALTTNEMQLEGGDLHGDNEVFFTSLSIVLKWFGTGGDGYPIP